MLATGVDVDTALTELAELQGPIADGVDPDSSGQAPVFESSEVAGVEAQSLQISPVVDLTYAGWDDELVVGTSPLGGRAGPLRRRHARRPTDAYRQTTDPLPDQLSMLVYLNTRSVARARRAALPRRRPGLRPARAGPEDAPGDRARRSTAPRACSQRTSASPWASRLSPTPSPRRSTSAPAEPRRKGLGNP